MEGIVEAHACVLPKACNIIDIEVDSHTGKEEKKRRQALVLCAATCNRATGVCVVRDRVLDALNPLLEPEGR